jgi:3-dehydrosphinganine reductase
MLHKNVVITGGSSGVGLALAQECLDRGASTVILIARSQSGLDTGIASLTFTRSQRVIGIAADVSVESSIRAAFSHVVDNCQSIDFVFANAGFAEPGLFREIEPQSLVNQMNVNYMGAAFTAFFALPLLAPGAHITFSGSVCSVLSFAGFSGYGPTKYALRGLAETLRNELKGSRIQIHLAVLSPIDTPGLARENEMKPEVCSAIEGTAALFSPREAAQAILRGIDNGDFVIVMEFLAWIIVEINCGIIPSSNVWASLLVAPFLPVIRSGAMKYIDFLATRKAQSRG